MENLIFNPINQDIFYTTSVQTASRILNEEKNKRLLESSIIQKIKLELRNELREELRNELREELRNELREELRNIIQKEFELHGWESVNHDSIEN